MFLVMMVGLCESALSLYTLDVFVSSWNCTVAGNCSEVVKRILCLARGNIRGRDAPLHRRAVGDVIRQNLAGLRHHTIGFGHLPDSHLFCLSTSNILAHSHAAAKSLRISHLDLEERTARTMVAAVLCCSVTVGNGKTVSSICQVLQRLPLASCRTLEAL